ncbi:MAG: hypothetical protein ACFFFD_14020 [Promethearchaeota archaeon]
MKPTPQGESETIEVLAKFKSNMSFFEAWIDCSLSFSVEFLLDWLSSLRHYVIGHL